VSIAQGFRSEKAAAIHLLSDMLEDP